MLIKIHRHENEVNYFRLKYFLIYFYNQCLVQVVLLLAMLNSLRWFKGSNLDRKIKRGCILTE